MEELVFPEQEGVRYDPDVMVPAFRRDDLRESVRSNLWKLRDGEEHVADLARALVGRTCATGGLVMPGSQRTLSAPRTVVRGGSRPYRRPGRWHTLPRATNEPRPGGPTSSRSRTTHLPRTIVDTGQPVVSQPS